MMFRRSLEVVVRILWYSALAVTAKEKEGADKDCDEQEDADESKEAVGVVH